LAQGGTLLLDEIGEMQHATQAKLLRVLEDGRVRRLGAKAEVQVDVRVLAATNKVPEVAISKGELRQDLYYRLNVFHIHLPPLRERKDDIPLIAEALLRELNHKHSCRVTELDPAVLDRFQQLDWPGNVRELRNALERAVILAGEGTVTLTHLPVDFLGSTATPPAQADGDSIFLRVGATVADAEKNLILRTLEHTRNNKTRAAELLGISLKTLHNKLKEYGAS
jgi:transcriptional regulator with PAS, ATPase and Fis domain